MTELQLRQKFVSNFAAFVGKAASGSANHKKIIDAYNSVLPHPRGYKMTYKADWCAAAVSANAIMCDMLSIFAFECSCTLQIQQWKAKGRWVEDDDYVPKTGDLIYYDWADDGKGDDTRNPDHVGIVEAVSGGVITVLEGNRGGNVGRRSIVVNGRYIRGFARPDYASLASAEEEKVTINSIGLPTVKMGDSGNTVKAMQMLLTANGYPCGKSGADGDFGADTEKAVNAYQDRYLGGHDGRCGMKTWKSLLGVK